MSPRPRSLTESTARHTKDAEVEGVSLLKESIHVDFKPASSVDGSAFAPHQISIERQVCGGGQTTIFREGRERTAYSPGLFVSVRRRRSLVGWPLVAEEAPEGRLEPCRLPAPVVLAAPSEAHAERRLEAPQ